MKKNGIILPLIFLTTISLFCFAYCGGTTNNETEDTTNANTEEINWDNAKSSRIFGLVEVYEDGAHIVVNWESRSRTDYIVHGELKDNIINNDGLFIFVRGKIYVNEENPFHHDILVTKIFVVSEISEPNWSYAIEKTITGLIANCDNDAPCIIEDPDSKSRISYIAYGENIDVLIDNMDRYIKVEALSIDYNKEAVILYKRDMVIDEVLEISDEPIN